MNKNKLEHIAIILDGNKRWAKKNKLNKIEGYSKGFENLENFVKYCLNIKLSNLTIFTLSSENFRRSSINIIYQIIYDNFNKIFSELVKKRGVKVKIFGSRENLPSKIKKIFDEIELESSNNNNLNLNIAFNYGFKDEIKNIFNKIKNTNLDNNFENENNIRNLFYLGNSPDPDLLIRTGGYQRLSNFIMYNLTYTELFFTDTLWPEFTEKEFKKIIDKYMIINRKYGL